MRSKKVNFETCDQPGGYSDQAYGYGGPPPRRDLICELYRGLTNKQGQMQIAGNWTFCKYKDKAKNDLNRNRYSVCDTIDQQEALLDYLSERQDRSQQPRIFRNGPKSQR